MTQAMKDDPNIWQRRPMSATMLRYAAEDVSQLLLLADKLSGDLGGAELRILPKLSAAYAQWCWDAADRDGAQPDSYRQVTAESTSQYRSYVLITHVLHSLSDIGKACVSHPYPVGLFTAV